MARPSCTPPTSKAAGGGLEAPRRYELPRIIPQRAQRDAGGRHSQRQGHRAAHAEAIECAQIPRCGGGFWLSQVRPGMLGPMG